MTFNKYWIPAIVWMVVLFIASSLPQGAMHFGIPNFNLKDKVEHIFAYGVLSLLLLVPLRRDRKFSNVAFVMAVTLSALYGVTDEIHQYFVPGRVYSGTDMFANYIGSLAVYIRKLF